MGLPQVSEEVIEVMMQEFSKDQVTQANNFAVYLGTCNPHLAQLVIAFVERITATAPDEKTSVIRASIAFDAMYFVHEALRRQDEVDALEQDDGQPH